MVDANLQRPPCALHKNVCNRSGLPADTFELYYGSKRLDGEAVLANWGVEKDSLIEVKTRGRGGVRGGGGGGSGLDGGGGVEGGGGGVGSCLRDGLDVDGVDGVFGSGNGVGAEAAYHIPLALWLRARRRSFVAAKKQQLQLSMQEREKEVEVHLDVLRAQHRVAQDERHTTAIELADRKSVV